MIWMALVLFSSCKEGKKEQFARLVQEWQGERDRVSAGYGFHPFCYRTDGIPDTRCRI